MVASVAGVVEQIWRVPYSQVVEIVGGDRPEADAVFVTCTNVATYDIIGPLGSC